MTIRDRREACADLSPLEDCEAVAASGGAGSELRDGPASGEQGTMSCCASSAADAVSSICSEPPTRLTSRRASARLSLAPIELSGDFEGDADAERCRRGSRLVDMALSRAEVSCSRRLRMLWPRAELARGRKIDGGFAESAGVRVIAIEDRS